MKIKPAILAMLVMLAMTGGVAALLGQLQAFQRLGQPGLVMIEEPVFDEDGEMVNSNTVALPHEVLNFESEPGKVTKAELSWLPRDTTFARRQYRAPDRFWINLSVVLMGQDRTSIHRPQICLTGQGWTTERQDLLEIPIGPPQSYHLPVMRMIARRPIQDESGRVHMLKAVYVYWFVSDGHVTARHGERMWWMAKDLLTHGVLERWAYVSCLAVGRPGEEEVMYARMERFIAASVPQFQLATR